MNRRNTSYGLLGGARPSNPMSPWHLISRTMKTHTPIFIAVGLLVMGSGCMTPDHTLTELDAPPIYHYWWNYYERGLQFLKAHRPQEARQAFEICLGLQPGAVYPYDKEAWQVRTYGLHILKSYFPKRELGISLFHLQDYARALPLLMASLEEVPSGRAKYFLNELRRKKLWGETRSPPSITINHQGLDRWKRDREDTLEGVVFGEGYIERISINEKSVFIELAKQERAFAMTLPLREGTNTFQISATDLLGQTTTTSLVWIADFQPPKLELSHAPSPGGGTQVTARCNDEYGVASVSLNNQIIFTSQASAQTPSILSVPFQLPVTSGHSANLQAFDIAGNELMITLSTEDLLNSAPTSLSAQESTSPPRLVLEQTNQHFHVFDEEFFLDGWAHDNRGLSRLTVNEAEALVFPSLTQQAYFSRRWPLSIGTNLLHIMVENFEGQRSQKTVTVIRKNPEYDQANIRLRTLTKSFDGGRAQGNAELIQRQFKHALNQEPPRFYLLNRSLSARAATKERELSLTAATDPRAKLKDDLVMEPELYFGGRIQDYENGSTVVVEVKEDENAPDPMLMEDVFIKRNAQNLDHLLSGLAMKIEQRFPVLEGRVEDINKRMVRLRFDSTEGLRKGSRYVIVPPQIDNHSMKSTFVRRYQDKMVELQIQHLRDREVEALILPKRAGEHIQLGDFVYSR